MNTYYICKGADNEKDKVVQETLEWAKGELEELNKRKRKLSVKTALVKEYLRTFINNPTTENYVLMCYGRANEMKRKEEMEDTND